MKLKMLIASFIAIFALSGCTQIFPTATQNQTAQEQKMVKGDDFVQDLALHDAVRAKDLALVKELISKGMEVNAVDKYGYTPLHLAARLNQVEIAQTLVESGATVNSVDAFGDTPLLDSTRNSTNSMSKLLICNGAQKNVQDKHEMTPLHNASKNNDLFIAMLLQTDDTNIMCEKLSITLEEYKQPENKICGNIPTGVATMATVTLTNDAEADKAMGPYEAIIEDRAYCAQLDKAIDTNTNYLVTAVATNETEKDMAIANLNDLRGVVVQKEEPSIYITGLYEALMEEFGPDFEPWNAELDKNGLVFRFKDPAMLFKHGSSDLVTKYKDILNQFFPRYLKVLKEYRDQIAEVRVEGHTSSVYRTAKNDEERYSKNKKLSQKRADKVFDYTLSIKDQIVGENLEWLMNTYKPYGMAYDDLIYDANGVEDQALSRRVEFRINKIMN